MHTRSANPAHVHEAYAKSDMFHEPVGHGMGGGTPMSTLLYTEPPAPGTIAAP